MHITQFVYQAKAFVHWTLSSIYMIFYFFTYNLDPFIMTLTYISILHAARHGGCEDLQGLFDHGPSLHCMGLQQTVENLGMGRDNKLREKLGVFHFKHKENICMMKDKKRV